VNRYATVPWPWIGLAMLLAVLAQELVARFAPSARDLVAVGWRIAIVTIGVASLALILMPGWRRAMLLGAGVCAGLMGYALYAQYGLGLEPCPLCVFQRVAVIACGIVFLVGALHDPGRVGSVIYALLLALCASAGALVAGRHVWLQSLPPDKVPACGPGLAYMIETLPFSDVLQKVLKGSGECAASDWRFLDLSMPSWTLVMFLTMVVASVFLARRS
jgi:protein dithiol:quinone oxidoreductase